MKVVIIKGGSQSFIYKSISKNGLGINIAPNDDMIEIFQWVNKTYKTMGILELFNDR